MENIITGTNLMFHSALLGSLGITENSDRRKCIRRHIRKVMEQLEEVLIELKEVAKELREVLAQIDILTAYIDLDTEEDIKDDKSTLACSGNGSKLAMGNLLNVETYSQSNGLSHLLHNSLCDSTKIKNVPTLHRRSCGDLAAQNGPTWPNTSWLFGRRKEIHSYDNIDHHALCCDDDDFDEEFGGRRSSRFSSSDSVFTSSPLRPSRLGDLMPRSGSKYHLSPGLKKKAMRSCSTQTVCDKSTQTALPHSPARQRAASEHKHLNTAVTTYPDHGHGGTSLSQEGLGIQSRWDTSPLQGTMKINIPTLLQAGGKRKHSLHTKKGYPGTDGCTSVYKDHLALGFQEKAPIASVLAQRWYMAPGVKRVGVTENGLKGTLFIPPGPGPFPAVLDLWGGGGGLVEYRSALLASRGYITLSLEYSHQMDAFGKQGHVGIEYFEMKQMMERAGKSHLLTVLSYPGAGHLIEPPYSPHCQASHFMLTATGTKVMLLWGGQTEAHSQAQEDSWNNILAFLEQHLYRNTKLVYCGRKLIDELTLDSYGIQSGSTVHILRKSWTEPEIQPEPVDRVTAAREFRVLQAALHTSSAYRDSGFKMLKNKESLDQIIVATPGLSSDPIALGVLQDKDLFLQFTDPNMLDMLISSHPPLVNAIILLLHSVAGSESTQQSPSSFINASSSSYSEMPGGFLFEGMSDDEEDFQYGNQIGPSSSSAGSSGLRPATLGYTGAVGPRPITQSELATALALASTPESSAVTPTIGNQGASSGVFPIPAGTPITNDLFKQALQQALQVSNISSLQSQWQSQLQQLHDMGIQDEELILRALQVTGGDIQASLELIFAWGAP